MKFNVDPPKLQELARYAQSLLELYGLDSWTFGWDNATRRYGVCRRRDRLITVSRALALANPQSETRETIRHEVAHALAPDDVHGPQWRAACARVGAAPTRCYDDTVMVPPGRWLGTCPVDGCRTRITRERLTKKTRQRRICATHRERLTWTINPDWLDQG